jgi:hypothetical protein
LLVAAALASALVPAQTPPDLNTVIERLDRLEQQNRELTDEIRRLRSELERARTPETPEAAPLAERVAVNEQRIDDQAQTKVEASQKYPLRLTGMFLFNSYINSEYAGTADYPTVASLTESRRAAGAYLRQSILGLEYQGPRTLGGGKVSGSLYMDFYAGTGTALNQLLRIRTGTFQVDWDRTTIAFAQDKPIFSPRNPDSLAQVGVSPLTGAGNPWLWQPQFRIEQRFRFGEQTGLRAQVGLFQTNENAATLPARFADTLERSRPGLEGRFEFKYRGLELAPGFHVSTTHVAGTSLPSNALSIDWLFRPLEKLEFTGLFYGGANLANLGTLRQGFTVFGPRDAIAVRTRGGWAQLSWLPTGRLSFHLMHGQNDDHDSDLRFGGIGKNLLFGGNVMYRLAPNVIAAFEGTQVRTTYINTGVRTNNHYDLAIAYLF